MSRVDVPDQNHCSAQSNRVRRLFQRMHWNQLAWVGFAILLMILWSQAHPLDIHQHSRYLNLLRRSQEIDARLNQNILEARLGRLSGE